MEKVKEPNVDEAWKCPRCHQHYCCDCVDMCEVDFEIKDKSDGFNTPIEQWEELKVCPWCYNQLMDLKNKGVTPNSSQD